MPRHWYCITLKAVLIVITTKKSAINDLNSFNQTSGQEWSHDHKRDTKMTTKTNIDNKAKQNIGIGDALMPVRVASYHTPFQPVGLVICLRSEAGDL